MGGHSQTGALPFYLKMSTYSQKLLDPRWQRKRLEIMERDGFKCSNCEDDKEALRVHHTYYVSGRSPWNYPNWSLVTLCKTCHDEEHKEQQEKDQSGDWDADTWELVIGFLGICKIADFDHYWDLSVQMQMMKEELVKKGKSIVGAIEDAILEMNRISYCSELPDELCKACCDPFPGSITKFAHTCGK